MIFFISLLGALFLCSFIFLVLYAKQSPEAQVKRRLIEMIEHAEAERAKKADKHKKADKKELELKLQNSQHKSFYDRVISPILDKLDTTFQKFAPSQIKNMLEEKIFQAGKLGVWSLPRVVTLWVISIMFGVFLAISLNSIVHLHYLQETVIMILGVMWGAVFPLARLNTMILRRQKKIRKMLPEFLDLLCVSVQAGLSFDAAVSKITSRMKGPLIDEFKRVQSDISLGMTHQYALGQMAKRCNLEEVYLFTASVIQSEKLGTSMGRTLKIQADNMRDRHRQFVKAEALKAPVKIIFPMVLFIFPSIFVVLLFPSILAFMKTMGG